MAVSFVAAGAVGTGTNPTAALPAGITAGDLLVIVFTGTAAPTTPAGWSVVLSQGTLRYLTVYSKVATASESNVTLSVTGTTSKAAMVAYRGQYGITNISAFNTGTSSSAQTPNSSSSYSNSVVVSLFTRTTGASTFSTPASTTSRLNSSSTASVNGILIVDETKATAGATTQRTSTLSNSGAWATALFVIAEPRNRYAVGITGSVPWNSTTYWSDTSGGASGASVPDGITNVFFDGSSGTGTMTTTTNDTCGTLTVTATQALTLSSGTGNSASLKCRGDVTFPTGGSFAFAGDLQLSTVNSGSAVLNTGDKTIPALWIYPTITTNEWRLGSNLVVSGTINHVAGRFDTTTNNYNITAGGWSNNTNSNTDKSIYLNGSTFTAPTFISNSGANYTVVNCGTSTINITGTGNVFMSPGSALSGITYYNVNITANPSYLLISGTNTFNNLNYTSRSTIGISGITFANNQTISGTLTLGSANDITKRIVVSSNTNGTARTITAASVATLSDVDFRDITVAGASSPWSGTRLGNSLGNTNITFGAGKTVYWNLAGTQNWSDAGWALTNNGTPSINNFPLAQDDVVFTEAGAAGTITYDANWYIKSLEMQDGVSSRTTAFTLNNLTKVIVVHGSVRFFPALVVTGAGGINFGNRSAATFDTCNIANNFGLYVSSFGSSLTLLNNLNGHSTSGFQLDSGTFNANNYNITVQSVSLYNNTTRTLNMGNGTWTLTGTSPWGSDDGLSTTLNAGNSTIVLSDNSTTTKTFQVGTYTLNNLVIGGNTSTSITDIYTSYGGSVLTINKLSSTKTVAHTIKLDTGMSFVINDWDVKGTSGNVVSFNSDTPGTQCAITINGQSTDTDYLSIKDINSVSVAPVFMAGANSTNLGNNTNIAFADAAYKMYVLSSSGTFNKPSDWNNANNEIHLFGAGGGGAGAYVSGNNRAGGGAGGGGGYTKITNQSIGSTTSFTIGAAGTLGASGANGGAGGTTIWDTVNTAAGGSGGTASATPTSAGGAGGTGSTYNGGTGGNGSTSTAASTGNGGGGGGGAGGPNGNGGNGGNGFASLTNFAGGGGGGNGGGSAGGNASSTLGGTGGNNFAGTGGGVPTSTTGGSGTNGGGGAGARGASAGGDGGSGTDISNGFGGGGGKGAGTSTANTSLFGSGGNGGRNTVAGTAAGGSAGSQGGIVILYAISTSLPINSNFFLLF